MKFKMMSSAIADFIRVFGHTSHTLELYRAAALGGGNPIMELHCDRAGYEIRFTTNGDAEGVAWGFATREIPCEDGDVKRTIAVLYTPSVTSTTYKTYVVEVTYAWHGRHAYVRDTKASVGDESAFHALSS